MSIGAHCGCPRSPFLSSDATEIIMKTTMIVVLIFSKTWKLSDIEYADPISSLSEDSNNSQALLDCLNDSLGMLRLCFTSSRCGMLPRNRIGWKPNFSITWKELSGDIWLTVSHRIVGCRTRCLHTYRLDWRSPTCGICGFDLTVAY